MALRSESKAASVSIIAVCQVAAMALWFSASAIIPSLVAEKAEDFSAKFPNIVIQNT